MEELQPHAFPCPWHLNLLQSCVLFILVSRSTSQREGEQKVPCMSSRLQVCNWQEALLSTLLGGGQMAAALKMGTCAQRMSHRSGLVWSVYNVPGSMLQI